MHLITMYILNGHLVLFHCFYICLILLIWTLVCCFRKMLPSMCSVRRHTQPVRLESLNRHNVSKQYSVSVSHRMVQYVLGIARLCCCTITQHLWRKKKKKILKKGTENVNTSKKGNIFIRMICQTACLHRIILISQAHAAQPQLLFESRLQRM